MFQTKEQLKKIYKDLRKIFGEEAVMKINDHIFSLWRKLEDLERSRDMWKKKYFDLKKKK